MTYEIKKMQPIPHKASSKRGESIYPFADLKIGEGFCVPAAKFASISSTASRQAGMLGRRFRVQKVDADRVQVCRVEDPK